MLELLTKIDIVNQKLLVLLVEPLSDDKELYIEKINQLLNERELLIQKVTSTQKQEEKLLGRRIIEDNERISQLLKKQTIQLKTEINHFNQKKKKNQTYDNPYQNIYVDGIFIDKKN